MDFDTQLRITLRFQCNPQAYCNVSLSTDIIGAKGLKPFARFFAALRMTFWAKSPPWQGGDLGEVSCHPTVTRPFTKPPLYENISSVRCDQKHSPPGPSEKDDLSAVPSTNGKGYPTPPGTRRYDHRADPRNSGRLPEAADSGWYAGGR
jgi:hypothetical protein